MQKEIQEIKDVGMTSLERQEKIVELWLKKCSNKEISDVTGANDKEIIGVVNKFRVLLKDSDIADIYEKNKAKILSATELKIITAMNNEELINNSKLSELTSSFKVIHDANRLECGKSTSEERILRIDLTKYEINNNVEISTKS